MNNINGCSVVNPDGSQFGTVTAYDMATDEILVTTVGDGRGVVFSASQLMPTDTPRVLALTVSIDATDPVDPGFVRQKVERLVIGLAGPIGSGKDTVAEFIANVYDDAQSYALAEPMANVAEYITGEEFWLFREQDSKKEISETMGITRRDVMRKIGQGVKDMFGEKVWLNRMAAKIEQENPAIAVVSDVRFDFEAEWVRHHGVMIHLIREDNPLADQMSSHVSDAGVTRVDGDYMLRNDYSKELLGAAVMEILHDLFQRYEVTDEK